MGIEQTMEATLPAEHSQVELGSELKKEKKEHPSLRGSRTTKSIGRRGNLQRAVTVGEPLFADCFSR